MLMVRSFAATCVLTAAITAAPAEAPAKKEPATKTSAPRQRAGDPKDNQWKVPPLPEDNLLKNPWFKDGLKHWVSDGNWQGETTKWGNPSTDDNAGTSGRISTGRRADSDVGKTVDVRKDAYLYQLVIADPANRTLKFDMYWVAHTLDPGEVNVYGGPSADGPWTHLWRPFHQVHKKAVLPPEGRAGNTLWRHYSDLTELVTTTLPVGYPFYKVEIHANLPDKNGGFKFTGMYFTATTTAAPAKPQK